MERAKANLRSGWAPAIGPDGPVRRGLSKARKLAQGQFGSFSQEVTRRDLIITGIAAGVSGLAIAAHRPPDARQVPLGSAPPLFEKPRSFAPSEDFSWTEETPFDQTPLVEQAAPMDRQVADIPRGPLLAERRLSLVNENTGEVANALYWADGDYVLEGLEEIQVLLRDHHTDEMHAIDLKLVETLYRLTQTLDSQRPLHVLSAYRSARTNARLAERFDGVAENSFHMKGKAVDIYLPGRRKRDLARAALKLRVGGVGVYSSFVHVDTGPVRRWDS